MTPIASFGSIPGVLQYAIVLRNGRYSTSFKAHKRTES
ncbi:MAG: hypothetical protein JWM87_4844 [Candidatus Eremiobacteraeota bacterium]|nr:hypothetical protein [Candidatus Eremiobacteraeota bacterium]